MAALLLRLQGPPPPPPLLPQGAPKLKSCLLTPRPGREGLKTEGRWWAPGGRRVLASLAVPAGCAAGSELAFLREPGDVVATWERPLVLPCRVEGEPPVSISWQRDGLALANDSSAILMPDAPCIWPPRPPAGASPPAPTSTTAWPRTALGAW